MPVKSINGCIGCGTCVKTYPTDVLRLDRKTGKPMLHYRLDYPDLDNENWQAWINIFKGEDGEMQFEKQAFGSWAV